MFVMNEDTRATFLESETMAADDVPPKGLIRVTNEKAAALAIANDGMMPSCIPVEALSNEAFLSAEVVAAAKREIDANARRKAERRARATPTGVAAALLDLGLAPSDGLLAQDAAGSGGAADGADLSGLAGKEAVAAEVASAVGAPPVADTASEGEPGDDDGLASSESVDAGWDENF